MKRMGNVTATRESEKALMVRFDDGTERWLPKSAIDDDCDVYAEGHTGELLVKDWFNFEDRDEASSSSGLGGARPAKPGACRSCGAAIIWVQLEGPRGPRPHPLDAEPEPSTRIVRFGKDGSSARRTQTWVSHFATCPNAEQHRRQEGDGQ